MGCGGSGVVINEFYCWGSASSALVFNTVFSGMDGDSTERHVAYVSIRRKGAHSRTI